MNIYGLTTADLLDKNHMPVLMILNTVSEKSFLEVLKSLSKGIGFGEVNGACTFPGDLDEFDKANGEELDGVGFGLYSGESIIIDYQTFYYYLKILSDKYILGNPVQASIVKRLLSDYADNFIKLS